MQKINSEKATGSREVSVEMIIASGKIRVKVVMDLGHVVLDGGGMPEE